MIPVRLKLRNFMPYSGDVPELLFTGIHTACISGENGSGKSSIIDAMTWALWGKTRAKSDDDLIHQGENEMEVEFDFKMQDELYRIVRKYSRSRSQRTSGKGTLDLFVYNGLAFIPMSGDTKTTTEQKITGILHMDYDTFINSAFLRQGHADEFSRQTPAKRKEVLASILGLDRYDEFEKDAREKARGAQNERLRAEASIGEISSELEKKSEAESELSAAEAELQETAARIGQVQSRLEALRSRHQELEAISSQCRLLEGSLARHDGDIRLWQSSLDECNKKISGYRELQAMEQEIDSGYDQLMAKRKMDEDLGARLRRLNQLKDHRHRLEQEFNKAQSELNSRYLVIEDRISRLEEKASALPGLKSSQESLQPRQQELNELQSSLHQKQEALKQKGETVAGLSSSAVSLSREIQHIQEKLTLFMEQADEGRCPLCESELGHDGLCLVKEKLQSELNEKEQSRLKTEHEIKQETAAIDRLNAELKQCESRYRTEGEELVRQTTRLAESMREALAASEAIASEQADLEAIAASLASRDFAGDTLSRINELEKAITDAGYDEARHECVRSEISRMEKFDRLHRELENAIKSLDAENEKAAGIARTIADINERHQHDRCALDSIKGKLAELPGVLQELGGAEKESRECNELNSAARQRLGAATERLEYLKVLSVKLKEKQKSAAAASRSEAIYTELATAFGKKGIQAMLIETSLPELEDEANRLLARMTDGRMSVTFETQRDTKKGDVAETLDIKIGDELGTRSYEMFSGGEAFRIDFAVRIALSRLLARRAGAPLPTLIIDEGFGTQDSAGIEKVTEAINSIQEEFRKIIVITHIDELKDAFPSHINVVKADCGSRIEVTAA